MLDQHIHLFSLQLEILLPHQYQRLVLLMLELVMNDQGLLFNFEDQMLKLMEYLNRVLLEMEQ